MLDPTGRFSRLRWLQNLVSVAGLLGSLLLMVMGLASYGMSGGGANIWLIVAGGFGVLIVVMYMTITPLLLKSESLIARQLSVLRDVFEELERHTKAQEQVAENTRLSDAAKALTHRDRELSALRTAIREDAGAEHWEAALNLVDEIEQRFGYRQEAERLREELDDARRDAIQHRLTQAIELIESHFQAHAWDYAQHEIDRLQHALPGDARVATLNDRMKSLKGVHKLELHKAWDEAVRRNDTDLAIDALKELDPYLSSAEAVEIKSAARDVFKEKLLQLGVQFRFAVKEKRWQDALDVGLQIVREYPNSRMASEVRDAVDTLRERARLASGAPASVASSSPS